MIKGSFPLRSDQEVVLIDAHGITKFIINHKSPKFISQQKFSIKVTFLYLIRLYKVDLLFVMNIRIKCKYII